MINKCAWCGVTIHWAGFVWTASDNTGRACHKSPYNTHEPYKELNEERKANVLS